MSKDSKKPRNGDAAGGDLSKQERKSLEILAGTVRKNLGAHPVSNAIGNAARTGKQEDYNKAAEGFEMLPGAAKKVVADDAVTDAHSHVQTSKLSKSIKGAVDNVLAARMGKKTEEKKVPKVAGVNNDWDFQNIPTDPALRRKMKKEDDWDPLNEGASWDWKSIPGHKKK